MCNIQYPPLLMCYSSAQKPSMTFLLPMRKGSKCSSLAMDSSPSWIKWCLPISCYPLQHHTHTHTHRPTPQCSLQPNHLWFLKHTLLSWCCSFPPPAHGSFQQAFLISTTSTHWNPKLSSNTITSIKTSQHSSLGDCTLALSTSSLVSPLHDWWL